MKPSIRALAFAGALLGCYVFGYSWRDLQDGSVPSGRSIQALVGAQTTASADSPEQVFRQNYNRILTNYVRPVKPEELKYAGMEGLLSSLGDPHTVFLPPRAAQAFSDETRANFFGVGAKLAPDPMGAKVAASFSDGPAYAAGLREGDLITAVDGKSVMGMEIDQIVMRVKGPEGTVVKLTIARKDKPKPIVLSIRRARIVSPTVESKYLADQKVGYMSIMSFAEPTTMQFDRELEKLEARELKGLIIDLRSNPGGLLETAVDMLSRFVSNKVVVKMKFRDGREEVAKSYPGDLHRFDYPIVLLVDEDSASAAEIFAGVLRDYGKATLVGEHTYGKASVQNVFPLTDQSSAKITIAHYFLPITPYFGRRVDEDGGYISGGIQPHVKVDLDRKKDPILGDPKTDSQLQRAIQVVLAK